jgi:hypothetical protein
VARRAKTENREREKKTARVDRETPRKINACLGYM